MSWSFVGIPLKPSYSASFSPLIFPTTLSFSNLSLNKFFPRTLILSPLQITLDPPGLDPGTTPWTVAHYAPLSMGFFRQEHWSGLPFPSPGEFSDPEIKPESLALEADSLPTALQGKTSFVVF